MRQKWEIYYTWRQDSGIYEQVGYFDETEFCAIPRIGERVSGMKKHMAFVVTMVIHRYTDKVIEILLEEFKG